jgi:catechol 2,3-dioxygenase-like lactoylglutathione lyase family enzyme
MRACSITFRFSARTSTRRPVSTTPRSARSATDGSPDFWLGRQATGDGFRESHLAFAAADRAAVDAFFAIAKEHGAEVLHEPRLWPEYHETYYGAFVRDPDGNNVEAVCHRPE